MAGVINYAKAKELAIAVISAKQRRIKPFDRENLFPDAIIPKDMQAGSQEHALYLFHSVSLDSMRQAEKVYSAMRQITQELGDLKELSKVSKQKLESILLPHFGEAIINPKNSMIDAVGTLLYNSKKLKVDYQNDPRLIKTKRVKSTLERVDEFAQYGIPKAALLMKNYVKFGIWPFSETEIPIKVDRHTLRISLGFGVVDFKDSIETIENGKELSRALRETKEQLIRMGHYKREDFEKGNVRVIRGDKFIKQLTETYLKITKKEKLSAIDLDDSFWAIGAYICKENNAIVCEHHCPIQCQVRYPSDNNSVYFFIDIDKRKNLDNLFKTAHNQDHGVKLFP